MHMISHCKQAGIQFAEIPIFPWTIFLEILAEIRASTVTEGTKMTSGMALIMFIWGTFAAAFFAAMAAGGVAIPVITV